jgi:ribosomal protein S18 acetylase RimI-like enzyme
MSPIAPLAREDDAGAAGVLARAFSDSPVYAAVLGPREPSALVRTLVRVKRGFVRAARHHGESRVARAEASGELLGVTLTFPPGAYPLSLRDELLQATGCATTGPVAITRFLRLTAYMRHRHLDAPHFYLFAIGVEPAQQGRGVGKALLGDLHARADAARAPCYLETEKAINVRLYESVGYRVVTDETTPGLGVRMWTMVRPAAG